MHNQLGVASVMSLIMLLMVLVANVFISKLNKGNSASSLL